MTPITHIVGREIMDSRGNPTVEAEVTLASGAVGMAAAPSGASTGSREALELRDQDPSRYLGKGVLKAVGHVNHGIRACLIGQDAGDQAAIDSFNCLGWDSEQRASWCECHLSCLACGRHAFAIEQRLPLFRYLSALHQPTVQGLLPLPMMNIINGGEHADNNVDIQEFMIQPVSATSFAEALRMGAEVFHCLKGVLKSQGYSTAVGDEGGFAPNLPSNEAALAVIEQAVAGAGYRLGVDVTLALDCAASEFYHDGQYTLAGEGRAFSPIEFADYLADLCDRYPIISIEDGMHESDWAGWANLTAKLGDRCQLVGDDLFVTNTEILQRGIDEGIANSILIKFNQIGTLSETLAAVRMAQTAGYTAVISHRSGETEDTTIADLAVGTGAGQIKTGSLCRSDRVAKYNQLLRIEAMLASEARYPGRSAVFGQG